MASDEWFDPDHTADFFPQLGGDDENKNDALLFDPLNDPEENRMDQEGWFESLEQYKERNATPAGLPGPSDYKHDKREMIKQLVVTIDQERSTTFKLAKSEIHIMRKRWGRHDPHINQLIDEAMGQQSRLFQVVGELGLSFKDHCRLLYTIYTAASEGIPPIQMFESDNWSSEIMVSHKDFMSIMKMIAKEKGNNECDGFWMKAEDSLNSYLKEAFISKRNDENLIIALDDDKMHCGTTDATKTFGFRRVRHIKANRFGHTMHTAGFSATGSPICAMFEREQETTTNVYERIIRKLFGSRTGNANPNLFGVSFCSDRGYWSLDLLFNKLWKWGADVVGTVARSFWFPFVFDKRDEKKDDEHGRSVVSMKGYRDVLYASLTTGEERKLQTLAFRSGTGTAVSLAMSSLHHGRVMDLNSAFPSDSRWYFNQELSQKERNKRAFALEAGEKNDENFELILDQGVVPLTVTQGDLAWFIQRQLSLTSSTVDRMITSRALEIEPSNPKRVFYELILALVDRKNLLPESDFARPDEENESDNESVSVHFNMDNLPDDLVPVDLDVVGAGANSNPNPDTDTDSDSESESESDSDDENFDGKKEAALWLEAIEKPGQRGEYNRKHFKHVIGNLPVLTMREIVTNLGGKAPASKKSLQQKLTTWIDLPSPLHRQFHFLNAASVKEELARVNPQAPKSGSKQVLLDRLVEQIRKKEERACRLERG